MKKLHKFLIAGIVIAVAIAIGITVYMEPYKPLNKVFANLDASQVESVQVLLGVYEATLSEEEISLLVPKLNQVKLVGRGTKEYRGYDGLSPEQFYIRLTDGTEFFFSASAPFYIINNEKGYRAELQLCGEINSLHREFALNHFEHIRRS